MTDSRHNTSSGQMERMASTWTTYIRARILPGVHDCDGLIRDGTLRLGKNNLLQAHFLNVAMKQNAETRKIRPVKIEERCHIDGFVAVIDALTVRQKWYEQIGAQLKNEE